MVWSCKCIFCVLDTTFEDLGDDAPMTPLKFQMRRTYLPLRASVHTGKREISTPRYQFSSEYYLSYIKVYREYNILTNATANGAHQRDICILGRLYEFMSSSK